LSSDPFPVYDVVTNKEKHIIRDISAELKALNQSFAIEATDCS
jgi:hypothetical protein